jgi:FtsP/CotA-like multicopper oxidase with cupredoxin domain
LLSVAVSALAGLAGPAGAADPVARSLDLTLSNGAVPATQRVLRVDKGDTVRLRVTSDAAGELHLHGYRVQSVLAPGVAAEISFKAFASGRFLLEWHAAVPAASAPASRHHAPPVATLEVRPK